MKNLSRSVLQKHLTEIEGAPARIKAFEKLGSGWHGCAFKITYRVRSKVKKVVLRTINPVGFSHDYPSDRASVFLLQARLFNSIPKHVRSVDVGGCTEKGRLISLKDAGDFFQIVEVATGTPYSEDLDRIKRTGKLLASDRKKALILSNYLVQLHGRRFRGRKEIEGSIRLRHLRDCVGHGEMLMGVLDTYPDHVSFAGDKALLDLILSAVRFQRSVRNLAFPIVRQHGDFHPGNIWFGQNSELELLDASREIWGLPADDVATLAINYIWYAVMAEGKFSGPFKELLLLFWNNYMKKTRDRSVKRTAALFFAFRSVVVVHPLFYPGQTDGTRVKLFRFALNLLKGGEFDPGKINHYIGAK